MNGRNREKVHSSMAEPVDWGRTGATFVSLLAIGAMLFGMFVFWISIAADSAAASDPMVLRQQERQRNRHVSRSVQLVLGSAVVLAISSGIALRRRPRPHSPEVETRASRVLDGVAFLLSAFVLVIAGTLVTGWLWLKLVPP
jgi:hypothetical protein